MTEPEPPPPPSYGTPDQRPSSPLFEFNRPTVVAALFLCTPFFLLTAVFGVALAYAWRADVQEGAAWEWTHYTYHIRTFWLAVGALAGAIALVVLVVALTAGGGETGHFPALLAAGLAVFALLALLAVRCVFALIRAQSREPMPRPRTWLV